MGEKQEDGSHVPREPPQLALPEVESPSRSHLTSWKRLYGILSWIPPRCRYDPKAPPQFSLSLNLLFGFAATFTVANLYYSHPILNVLSTTFHVSHERVSIIPTVSQAGYATGLLFVCPLGDLIKRRPMVLFLQFFTVIVWIGLCLTTSFATFTILTYITSVTTVTPQLMLPLVAELAPPDRRATSLSIVTSGLLMGILIARILSGVIAAGSSWRNVYWMAFSLQFLIVVLMWLFMPDYPRRNTKISYFRILWSILELVVKSPLLVQSCLIAFCISYSFTSFWTTLTFLLSGAPYYYSTALIGLFAFAGLGPMFGLPVVSRLFIDRFHPFLSVIVGNCLCLGANAIGAYTGTFTVAGPVIQAIFSDFGQIIVAVACRTNIFSVAPKAGNRVNTAFMLASFCGQLTGTAAGNQLFAQEGWIRSSSATVGILGASLVICFVRGPHETRWFGWHGGFDMRRKTKAFEQEPQLDPQPPERLLDQQPKGGAQVDVEKGMTVLQSTDTNADEEKSVRKNHE